MFHRSISWVLYVFVVLVLAAAHSDSRSITGSDAEVTVHHLSTENSEHSSQTPSSAEPTTTTTTTTTTNTNTTARPPARPDGTAFSPPRMTTMEDGKKVKEGSVTELGALLDAGAGAIVTLVAGDTRLAVHRAVLADRSTVFADMFSQDMVEDRSSEVPIHDVEGPVLRQLVAYLYSQQAPQLTGTTPQLLAAAHKYGVTELKAQCEQLLAAHLTVENAAAAAVLAVRYSCSSLRQAAVAFIKARQVEVKATQGWAEAMLRQPNDLIEVSHALYDLPAGSSVPAATGNRTAASTAAASTAAAFTAASTATATTTTTASTAASTTNTSTTTSTTTASTAASTTAASTATSNITSTAASATEPNAASNVVSVSVPHQSHSTEPTPALDEAAISHLRNLSSEEKGRRLRDAAQQGNVSELRALLAAGADAGAGDEDGWTALHWTAGNGYVQAARCLLEAGAPVDASTNEQNTPLHFAAANGKATVARLLLSWKADVNAKDDLRNTPLHYAALSGHVKTATALLEAGADRQAENKWGLTPLDVAMMENQHRVIQMLT